MRFPVERSACSLGNRHGGALGVKLTAVFRKVPGGYIGFIEELPGANTQGKSLKETRANLKEAVDLVLQANRALAEESLKGEEVIREPFEIPAR